MNDLLDGALHATDVVRVALLDNALHTTDVVGVALLDGALNTTDVVGLTLPGDTAGHFEFSWLVGDWGWGLKSVEELVMNDLSVADEGFEDSRPP